jgi:hypothetical protein
MFAARAGPAVPGGAGPAVSPPVTDDSVWLPEKSTRWWIVLPGAREQRRLPHELPSYRHLK